MYRSVAVPGQFDNCAVCEKRFTVTSYTKAGPDGGLLCPRCAKELDDDEKAKQKKKPMPNRHRQRQMRSDLLDGVATKGALSLVRLCLKVGSFYLTSLFWAIVTVACIISCRHASRSKLIIPFGVIVVDPAHSTCG